MVPTGIAVYVSKSVAPLFSHTTYTTPKKLTIALGVGTYFVYEESSSNSTFSGPQLQPSDVTVTPQSGVYNNLGASLPDQVLGAGGTFYLSAVSFNVGQPGVFMITIASPQGQSVKVFVAGSIASTLVRNLGWFGFSGAGGLLFILGLVLLIVRGVQRSRRRAPLQFASRCANGHPASPQDRFCHVCGAPVYAPPVVAQR